MLARIVIGSLLNILRIGFRISQETKDLIDKLLLERIPLAGIARVVGVSERWLQRYVNQVYQEVPKTIEIDEGESIGKLVLQCDEMWSFVEKKEKKQWIWLAIDQNTGKVVGA